MLHIDYYFSTISPFAYLAGNRLEAIAEKYNASINYKPVDIMALFSKTGGVLPTDRHPSRQAYRLSDLKRQSTKNKLHLNLSPSYFPTNSAPSAYAVITAQTEGGGDLGAFVRRLLSACWAEEQDISCNGVIKSCLIDANFDPVLADSGLLEAAETYANNLEEAVKEGVFGSPFYVVDGSEKFWGQDRLNDLEAYLSGEV